MSTSVKHIHNGMRGAPQISGSVGTLIAALDALFVSGWGPTTALAVNVSGGIATATLTPGETFERDAVVLIAGATPGALNGEARVLTTGSAFITFATAAPDGAATGTITIRYAPQTAWSKVFSGTNKAVYRSTHVQSSGHHLRVDDTGTTSARVVAYESMADVDAGIGAFPTAVQMSGGGYWFKSALAGAGAVNYKLFCDERFLLVAIAQGTYAGSTVNTAAALRGFGDPISLAPSGDAWSTLMAVAGASSLTNNYGRLDGGTIGSIANGSVFLPRAISGLGGSVMADSRPYSGGNTSTSGQDNSMGAVPSVVDGQIKISRMFLAEQGTGNPPRAELPGVYFIPQNGAYSLLAHGDFLQGAGALAGRRLMALHTTSGAPTGAPVGAYLIDITGPWR